MKETTFIGIDVSKDVLEVAVRPSGERWTQANDEASIASLVQRLKQHVPTLVILEATGGFETAGAWACQSEAGWGFPALGNVIDLNL